MNVFKRIYLSLIRKPGRTLILFFIVFLLGNLIASSFSIYHSTNYVKNEIKNELASMITVHAGEDFTFPMYFQDKKEYYSSITSKVDSFVEDNQDIEYYDYSYSASLGLKKIDNFEFNRFETLDINAVTQANFSFLYNKDVFITEGRTFTEEELDNGSNVIILNKDSFEENCEHLSEDEIDVCKLNVGNYKVGDKIQLSNIIVEEPFLDTFTEEEMEEIYYESEEYEIIGFYESVNELDTNYFWKNNAGIYAQRMKVDAFIPLNTVEKYINKGASLLEEYRQLYPEKRLAVNEDFYRLKSISIKPVNADIVSTVQEKLQTYFAKNNFSDRDIVLQSSQDAYELVTGSVESLSEISIIVLIISVIVSIVILSLVITIFLRDRKHEMGIYLSLGDRKHTVICQIFLEAYIIGLIAITLSLSSGLWVGQKITDRVLEVSNAKQEELYSEKLEELGSVNTNGLSFEDVSKKVVLKYDTQYIVGLYVGSSIVILLSTIMPMVYILKLDPKKIML